MLHNASTEASDFQSEAHRKLVVCFSSKLIGFIKTKYIDEVGLLTSRDQLFYLPTLPHLKIQSVSAIILCQVENIEWFFLRKIKHQMMFVF